MQPDDLLLPAAFHKGHAYFLERSELVAGSYFGGPSARSITGLPHGSKPLHHLATLNGDCIEPLWHVIGRSTLPLFYGMCYDGCRLKYRYAASEIELLEMEPAQSDPTWPYPDYPAYLPYFPLRLGRNAECSIEEFSELGCQGLSVATSSMLVVIPPSPVLGMSLWGPFGDAEGTQIVFECDLANRIVKAFNQCA